MDKLEQLKAEKSLLKLELDRTRMKLLTIKALANSESTTCFKKLKELINACSKSSEE